MAASYAVLAAVSVSAMRPTLLGGAGLAACLARQGIAKRCPERDRSQLSELRSLEKENARLKKIVAELELDKLILKEGVSCLKPKA